jgi:hypothetical protein
MNLVSDKLKGGLSTLKVGQAGSLLKLLDLMLNERMLVVHIVQFSEIGG